MRRGLLEATGNVAGQNLATYRRGDRLSWGGNSPPTRWTKACNGGDQQSRGEWAEKRQEFQEQAQKRCGQRLLGSSLPSPGDPLASPLLRSILALGLPFLSFLRLYPHSFFFFFCSSSCLQSQKTSLRPANRRLPVLNHFVSSGLIFFQN